MNMVSRVIEPFKKQQSAIIRPVNLPRIAGRVYIRQLEDYSPWESNRVVIKMVTHDPASETNIPYDPSLSLHRSENSPQKASKAYSLQMNRSPGKSSATSLLGYENFSAANKFLNSDSSHRPTSLHYLNPHVSPYKGTLNEYRPAENLRNVNKHHDSHSLPSRDDNKHSYQKFSQMVIPRYRDSEKISLPSSISIHPVELHQARNDPELINVNHHRHPNGALKFQSNDKDSDGPGFLPLITNQYSDYWSKGNKEDGHTKINITDINESQPSNHFSSTSFTHKHVIRTDRMVPNNPVSNTYRKRDEVDSLPSSNWKGSRDIQQGPMIRFGIDDVRNSETMALSEVRHASNHEISFGQNKTVITKPRNFAIDDRENSVSIGKENVNNITRGKSVKHIDIKQTDSPAAKTLQSRYLSYKTIDRSHRSHDHQNASTESTGENPKYLDRTNETKSRPDYVETTTTQKVDCNAGNAHNCDVEDTHGVTNLTASNRWRFQKGRQPTRVVKAVYRRQPISSTITLTRGMMERNTSSKNIRLEKRSLKA